MELDTASLGGPTYRFMQGVPGRPMPLEIARRLGLSETIFQDAMKMTTWIMMSIKLLKIGGADLESRKRFLGYHSRGHKKILNSIVPRKLYNELDPRERNRVNKAREEAKEIVDGPIRE